VRASHAKRPVMRVLRRRVTVDVTESRFNPVDLALFVRAMGLARLAQRATSVPLPKLVAEMSRRRRGSRRHSADRLSRATVRATSRWSRWFGGFDTCLVRSLVLGALLADRTGVALNIGFRPGEDQSSVDGHAWVTIDGSPVGPDGNRATGHYSRLLAVPFGDRERIDD
jgi:hypothetical protein